MIDIDFQIDPAQFDLAVGRLQQLVAETTYRAQEAMVRAMQGPKSGRVYRRLKDASSVRNWKPRKKGQKRPARHYREHQAARRGEAPAVDTGNLFGGLDVQIEELTGTIDGPFYGGILEEKGFPFVAPALELVRPAFEAGIQRIVAGGTP